MSKSIFNKQSIILFFVLGLAVIASVSVLTYMNIKDQQSDHEFIQETYIRNALLDNIYSNITEAETLRRGYHLSRKYVYHLTHCLNRFAISHLAAVH